MGIFEVLDRDNRSEFLDRGEELIHVPRREDVEYIDKEDLLCRLDKIQSPGERLREFLKSLVQHPLVHFEATHESNVIKSMGFGGLAFGWLIGGVSRSSGMTEQYIRQHNASVFDNKHRSKRAYVATYFYSVIRRGAKFGVGSALLCYSAGTIAFGSITYRNELFYPDWFVCFGTLGAVSRCWLGLRGVAAGFGFGVIGGTIGFTLAKCLEGLSGKSITQLRYLEHMEYLHKREAALSNQHRIRAENDREYISPWL